MKTNPKVQMFDPAPARRKMTSSQKLLVAELPDVYGIIQTSQEDSLMEDINRKKALAAALSQIDKQFGKGSAIIRPTTTSKSSRPAPSGSTSRSASAACRAAA
jgi:hypothetical protein